MRRRSLPLAYGLLLALVAAAPAPGAKAEKEKEKQSESDGLIRAAFYNMVRKDLDRTQTLFRRAVARAEELGEVGKELEARILLTDYMLKIGKPREAEKEINLAAARLAANPGEHKVGAAELKSVRAVVELELGRFKNAQKLFSEVHSMVAAKADEDESDKLAGSVADQGLAAVSLLEDDMAKVKERATKGLLEARRRFGGDSMFSVSHLLILSRCARREGDLKQAMGYLHEAKATARKAQKYIPLYGAGFGLMVSLGLLDLDLLIEARQLNDHCRSQLEDWLGADNLRMGMANLVGAMIAARDDRLKDAVDLGKKAMATLVREYGPQDYRVGLALFVAGVVNHARGDFAKAEEQILQARKVLAAEFGAEHSMLVEVQGLLAVVRKCLGKPEAEADFAEALRLAAKHEDPRDPVVVRLKELFAEACPKPKEAGQDPGFLGVPPAAPAR